MRVSFGRIKNYCGYCIGGFLKGQKKFLCINGILILLGIIIGIIVASTTTSANNVTNFLIIIKNGEYNIFGVYIKSMLSIFCCYALIFVSIFSKWISPLPYLTMFFIAYRFGVRIVVIFLESKMLGIICIITNTLPYYLVFLASLSVCVCGIREYISVYGYYRRCSNRCRNIMKIICKKFGMIFAVVCTINIIILLIIPSIAKFIIVV